MYASGLSDLDKDAKKAITLFRRSTKEGSIFAKVQLARCYWLGLGVDEDQSKAEQLLGEAAEVGPKRLKFLLRKMQNPMWPWYDYHLEI